MTAWEGITNELRPLMERAQQVHLPPKRPSRLKPWHTLKMMMVRRCGKKGLQTLIKRVMLAAT